MFPFMVNGIIYGLSMELWESMDNSLNGIIYGKNMIIPMRKVNMNGAWDYLWDYFIYLWDYLWMIYGLSMNGFLLKKSCFQIL